jgi:hypothetical protein
MSQPLAGSAHRARTPPLGVAHGADRIRRQGRHLFTDWNIALRLAAGLDGGRLLDPHGALGIVFRQPFGQVLLALIGAGILTCVRPWIRSVASGAPQTSRGAAPLQHFDDRRGNRLRRNRLGTVDIEARLQRACAILTARVRRHRHGGHA